MRVLFVCTANVCRSRMAEQLFRILAWNQPVRSAHEARSAGTHAQEGGRQLTEADLDWADVVCVMEWSHRAYIDARWPAVVPKVRVFEIPDIYVPGDPVLADRLGTHILTLLAEPSIPTEPGFDP